MGIQNEFLEYLRSQVPQRVALTTSLGGDGRVCVYYICPFSTLRNIMERGVLCRKSPAERIDLSSPEVQRRRKTVWLARSATNGDLQWRKDVPIHCCINLFWNPLNRTFDALQRNGLIRTEEGQNAEHGILCILELDAEMLLTELHPYWAATKGNAASNAFSSVSMTALEQFPWTDTFATGDYTKEHPWQARAAELIVFLGDPSQQECTNPIPSTCITRILLSPEVRLTKQQQKWLAGTGLHCHRTAIFKSGSSLLMAERQFIRNIVEYRRADKDCASRLTAALRIIVEFESSVDGLIANLFASPAMVHSHHGIGHVTRVMFWTAFLSTYPFGLDGTQHHTAAILAALLHDLERSEPGEDRGHGKRTLEEHKELVDKLLDDPALRESCASAVEMHGIDDAECQEERRDQIWQLLKDADGLERGRFRRPDSPDGLGCKPEMLRFGYLDNVVASRKSMPWLARQLAGITKYSQWNRYPCQRLLKDLFFGLSSGLNLGIFTGEDLAIAKGLRQELSALVEEMEYLEWAKLEAAYDEVAESWEEEPGYDEDPMLAGSDRKDDEDYADWDDHDIDWEDLN